jgi:hypothetical protein
MGEIGDMNSKNKRMTLDQARVELEREGLSCDFVTDQRLVGVSTKCHWNLATKMDVVVFVQKVPGDLTRDRYWADRQLLTSWVEEHNVGGNDFPPMGCGHGRLVLLVYYADTVEPGFGYEICHFPGPLTPFGVAAQDAKGESFYLAEANRPFIRSAFDPELRYLAQKLTGANGENSQPSRSRRWFTITLHFLVWCLSIPGCISMPRLIPVLVVPQLLFFLVAAIMQWCQKRRSKKRIGVCGRSGVREEDGTASDTCDIHKV